MDSFLVDLDAAVAHLNDTDPIQDKQLLPATNNVVVAAPEYDAIALTHIPEPLPHPNVVYSCSRTLRSSLPTDEYLINLGVSYLHWHAEYTKRCPHLSQKKGKTNSCSCLSIFSVNKSDPDNPTASNLTHATAQFIAYFAKLDCPKQQMYVMNWYRTAFANWKHNQTNNSKDRFSPYHYEVPILSDPDNNLIVELDKVPPVCMSAIQIVSGKRVSFWRTCMCHVQSNTIPEHGLVGKPSNNSTVLSETIDKLRAFFKEIEDFCDIVPMRFI
jgi:hypothetical protein